MCVCERERKREREREREKRERDRSSKIVFGSTRDGRLTQADDFLCVYSTH